LDLKQKNKYIILIILLTLVFLFISDLNTNTYNNTHNQQLGYTNEDLNYLKSIYNNQQIAFILNNNISKDILFSYIETTGFILEKILEYEQIRFLNSLTHQGAINLYNHPNIMKNFYQDINKAFNTNNNLILVNKNYALDKNYIPNNLVFAKDLRLLVDDNSRYYMKKEAYINLKALFNEAKKNELSLILSNAYRSYEKQDIIYEQYRLNFKDADYFSARPGHSEHQTGLAVDLTCKDAYYLLIEEFENTKEGIFIKQNAHLFGFIIRYPKDKTNITGYTYEPWHIRYVGSDVAKFIYQNNLTLEEYLLNYTFIPK